MDLNKLFLVKLTHCFSDLRTLKPIFFLATNASKNGTQFKAGSNPFKVII
jgi:hypothetical protein